MPKSVPRPAYATILLDVSPELVDKGLASIDR